MTNKDIAIHRLLSDNQRILCKAFRDERREKRGREFTMREFGTINLCAAASNYETKRSIDLAGDEEQTILRKAAILFVHAALQGSSNPQISDHPGLTQLLALLECLDEDM